MKKNITFKRLKMDNINKYNKYNKIYNNMMYYYTTTDIEKVKRIKIEITNKEYFRLNKKQDNMDLSK